MYFVFDIETVPDLELVRRVIENPEKDNDKLLTRAGEELAQNSSGFLPPMYHRVVSWVGLWIENNGSPKQKKSWNGKEEQQGLAALFNALGTYKDFGLIHHNGRGFDLPVLTYRAMKHGLQMPLRLSNYDIRYRYSKHNVDLQDEFSNYGASTWPQLKHLGYLIDMPVKQTGQGNDVLQMFRDDKLGSIEHYCYEDVMATYVVWLHLQYTVGDISKERFDNLQQRAMKKLNEIQDKSVGDR